MTDIVYFYAELSEADRKTLALARVGGDGSVQDYRAMAVHAFASARFFAPEARIVHVTDDQTVPLDGADSVFRLSETVSLETITYLTSLGIAEWAANTDEPFIWTELDSLFSRPVEPAFAEPFDVALVRRVTERVETLPYMSGLVYVRPTEGTFRLFCEFHRVLQAMPRSLRMWWTDMLIWAILLGTETAPGTHVTRHGADVALLHFQDQLGIPILKREGVIGLRNHPSKYATLHFKGPARKAAMEAYANDMPNWV